MQQIRKDFLRALRSGEYQQGFGQLRRGDCFCAQGVIGDVIVKHGLGSWDGEDLLVFCRGKEVRHLSHLPLTVDGTDLLFSRDMVVHEQFVHQSLKVPRDHGLTYFSVDELNDTLKLSLGEIADILEKSWSMQTSSEV